MAITLAKTASDVHDAGYLEFPMLAAGSAGKELLLQGRMQHNTITSSLGFNAEVTSS